MTKKLPYAEDLNYWKTSQSPPDSWMDKTKKLVTGLGGKILASGFGEDGNGHAAFMLQFQISEDAFKAIWPVLPTWSGKDERAARVQAATMLYHDVKAKCLAAVILGPRAAFFGWLMLPDGRTASEASAPELMRGVPALFASVRPELGPGTIEGDYE